MTQIQVGATVKVNARVGLFYTHNAGKVGKVVRINNHQVHVRFDAGGEDYGNFGDVTLITPAPTVRVGDRVRITNTELFNSCNRDKEGDVTRLTQDGRVVYVQLSNGSTDYGYISDVTLVAPIAKAVPTAKNGMKVGDKVRVRTGDGNRGSFYARHENKVGTITSIISGRDAVHVTFEDGSSDCGYTIGLTLVTSAGFTPNLGSMPVARGTMIDVEYKDGLVMLNVSAGSDNYGVSTAQGLPDSRRRYARSWALGNGGSTIVGWRLAVAAPVTLETELAGLKGQLDAIKAEKTVAEAQLATAKAKVDAIESRRVALVATLTKHGIQFIGEDAGLNGEQAHQAGLLKVGTKLLCNVTPDPDENIVGKTYEVKRVDVNDSTCTYRLSSEDGHGFWVLNSKLNGYTLVA